MKHKSRPWQEKVDDWCLNYLKVYREARILASKMPQITDVKARLQTPNPAEELFKAHPEVWETRKVSLTPEFLEKIEQIPWLASMGLTQDSVLLKRTADIFEATELISSMESYPAEVRMSLYFLLATLIVPTWDTLVSMRRGQFGEKALDEAQFNAVAAQFCEMFGQIFRGRLPEIKGRHNLELVGLIKKILEHQKEELSPNDLGAALEAAGMIVPSGEPWRIWLWRARKAKLIPGTLGRSQVSRKKLTKDKAS